MHLMSRLKQVSARCSMAGIGVALSLAPAWSMAADAAADKALAATLQKLLDRVQQLEQRNQTLERRVEDLTRAKSATAAPTVAPAAAAVPAGGSVATDSRLQTIERQQQTLEQQMQALVRPLEPDEEAGADGPTFDLGLVGVYQQVNGKGSDSGSSTGRFSFRGDVGVSLPAGSIGDANGLVVGQIRFGQGNGVSLRPTHTGTVNSTTFQTGAGADPAGRAEETYAILAQAYYQLQLPLDNGRLNDQLGTRAELTIGKMDFFAFFDQNAVADDESVGFLNNAFVHNPLLDSGGDIGADSYGFAPGVRAAYIHEADDATWGASLGVFAAGDGAQFDDSPGQPLVIAQVDYAPKQINGEARGNYRLYAWTNGRTSDFDGRAQRHTGIGLSVDQRIGAAWNLFGRYGQRTSGHGPFDRALTLGLEHSGRTWGRSRDAIGFALASLDTSGAWRRATGADSGLVGFRASGQETIAELYYRLTVNDTLAITPDFQWIHRPGGDGRAPSAAVFGVRASLGF